MLCYFLENNSKATPPPASDSSKPVNPLRLARPLEKSGGAPTPTTPAAAPPAATGAKGGLARTVLPFSRPMPLPTVSPLCPPGYLLLLLIEIDLGFLFRTDCDKFYYKISFLSHYSHFFCETA